MSQQRPPLTSLRVENVNLEAWRELVNTSFVPLQVTALGSEFRGSLSLRIVDDVAVFDLSATPHLVQRTPELIARSSQRYYKLSLQLQGVARLTQDGRTALVHPGDLAIYDTTRPYELRLDGDNHSLIIMFPHHFVDLPPGAVADVTAVVFSRESVLGRVIIPFLTELGATIELLHGPDGHRLVHSALDLLVTLLSSELHVESDPRRRLAHDIRGYIDSRLSDTELSPASIAKAHFISTRHLHAIFALEGVSLSTWVRERRLERIRRDLADPSHANDSLQQLAAKWGLVDAAHFSKLFKTRYDESPSDYRRRILTTPTP